MGYATGVNNELFFLFRSSIRRAVLQRRLGDTAKIYHAHDDWYRCVLLDKEERYSGLSEAAIRETIPWLDLVKIIDLLQVNPADVRLCSTVTAETSW